MEKLQIVHYL